jgi:hypothetical protein
VAAYPEKIGSGPLPGSIGVVRLGTMDAIIGFVLGEFGFEFFVLGLLAAGSRLPAIRRREAA